MKQKNPVIAVMKTKPETVVDDYGKLMDLAEYSKFLPKTHETIIKLNLSWSLYFPACSTEPWQLDGVLKKMTEDGYKNIHPVENRTVVTDPWKGAELNKWLPVIKKYGLRYEPLTEVEWTDYKPKFDAPNLGWLFHGHHRIPNMFIGKNVVHLPTMKCVHGDTLITTSKGLIKINNLFGETNNQLDEEKRKLKCRILTYNPNGRDKTKFVNATIWKNKTKGNIYKITLKTGKEVIVSLKHPFLTQDGWVQASELDKNYHKIATLKRNVFFRNRGIKFKIQRLKIKKSHNKIIFPEKSSDMLGRWLAYFIAEGCFEDRDKENYAIHFTNYSDEILTDFKELSAKLFGIKFKEKKSKKEELFFHSKELIHFLKKIGAIKYGKKTVPLFLTNTTYREVINFLVAYIESDGSIETKNKEINITTINKENASLIQMLYQKLGIVSFMRKTALYTGNTAYTISIYGENIKMLDKFNPKFITGKNAEKYKYLIKTINNKSNKYLTNYDFIPVSKERLEKLIAKLDKTSNPFTKRERGNRFLQSIIYYNKKIPRKSFKYLLNALKSKLVSNGRYDNRDFKYLKFLADDTIIWEDIKEIKIKDSDIELFDLTIEEESHNFIGNGIILHNTHGHTQITGAIKNAFGGLITKRRHHSHKVIDEILVELLQIQQEIHPGIFAVTDGTVCGDGAGPRTMQPVIKNYILAGADQVAIDAVSAKMMGFDPMKIKFIKMAHDKGLGIGDIDQIDIVGENIKNVNFGFKTGKSPVVFMDQTLRKNYPILEPILFHTWLFNLCIFGSETYHDHLWYPIIGKARVKEFMKTEWGRLFQKY